MNKQFTNILRVIVFLFNSNDLSFFPHPLAERKEKCVERGGRGRETQHPQSTSYKSRNHFVAHGLAIHPCTTLYGPMEKNARSSIDERTKIRKKNNNEL